MKIFYLLVTLVFLSAAAMAQDIKAEKVMGQAPQMSAEDQAMMEKMQKYATPNENHKVLDKMVGEWTYTSKMWMKPDQPPMESTGTASAKWTMDGRFVEQNATGEHMGQSFVGRSVIGYDNAKSQYVSVWYDSMGTGMMISQGKYDPATKTMEVKGDFDCPIYGKTETRWVTKFIDDNTYSFEGYMTDDKGKENKGMEIVYKRK